MPELPTARPHLEAAEPLLPEHRRGGSAASGWDSGRRSSPTWKPPAHLEAAEPLLPEQRRGGSPPSCAPSGRMGVHGGARSLWESGHLWESAPIPDLEAAEPLLPELRAASGWDSGRRSSPTWNPSAHLDAAEHTAIGAHGGAWGCTLAGDLEAAHLDAAADDPGRGACRAERPLGREHGRSHGWAPQ